MIQITRILCPVDFSDHSRHALDHAVAIARWYHAAITVLHVHRVPMPSFAVGPVMAPEAFLPAMLSEEERVSLRRVVEEFAAAEGASGVAIDVLVDEALNIADAVVTRASELPADLIAIGTHGRSGFNRLVLGSVTEKVVRTAPCPVLTVPPRALDAASLAASGITRIICPIDFSDSSAPALRYAASLAQQAQARLTVVHVVELAPDAGDMLVPEGDVYRAARFEAARRSMSETITADVRQACAIDELLLAGRPYREILRLAGEQHAGLVVMGVRGRGAVDRMFFGSTTQHVVRQAPCPVLTIRD